MTAHTSKSEVMEIAAKTSPTDDELLAFAASPDPARLDELSLADLSECYSRNPKSYALSSLVGLVTQRTIEKTRTPAREQAKAEAKKREPAELAERRALADYSVRDFYDLLDTKVGLTCPGTERDPHTLRGYVVRQGWAWSCRFCGAHGDLRPHAVERHRQAISDDG